MVNTHEVTHLVHNINFNNFKTVSISICAYKSQMLMDYISKILCPKKRVRFARMRTLPPNEMNN